MKHLLTLTALLISSLAMGQNPNYDPDANGDNLIGAEDLVSFLAVYNTSLAVDTTLECDFDGTAEDEWIFGVFTGEVVIDSFVVQYSISDSATYFEPGCPTPQVYYLDVEMEYTLFLVDLQDAYIEFDGQYQTPWGTNSSGKIAFNFNAENGQARWNWYDSNLGTLKYGIAPYDATFNFATNTNAHYACINTSEYAPSFTISEDGLVGDLRCNGDVLDTGPWNDSQYNYFRILPYWHYAE